MCHQSGAWPPRCGAPAAASGGCEGSACSPAPSAPSRCNGRSRAATGPARRRQRARRDRCSCRWRGSSCNHMRTAPPAHRGCGEPVWLTALRFGLSAGDRGCREQRGTLAWASANPGPRALELRAPSAAPSARRGPELSAHSLNANQVSSVTPLHSQFPGSASVSYPVFVFTAM